MTNFVDPRATLVRTAFYKGEVVALHPKAAPPSRRQPITDRVASAS